MEDVKNKIEQLRAKGWTLSAISDELGVEAPGCILHRMFGLILRLLQRGFRPRVNGAAAVAFFLLLKNIQLFRNIYF